MEFFILRRKLYVLRRNFYILRRKLYNLRRKIENSMLPVCFGNGLGRKSQRVMQVFLFRI